MSNYRYPGGPLFNPFGLGVGVGAGNFKELKEKEIKNGDVSFLTIYYRSTCLVSINN